MLDVFTCPMSVLYFRPLTSHTPKLLMLAASEPDGFCVTQLQRLIKGGEMHIFLAIHYLGMCMGKIYAFIPTLNYSFVRNKYDGQAEKQPAEIFIPSIIMAEVSRREEKLPIVQHAAAQCGQMFVLAAQK